MTSKLMTTIDTFSPAFCELVQDATDAELEIIFDSTGPHRLVGGKNARLLRVGDIVAISDLSDATAHEVGTAWIIGTQILDATTMRVITAGHGAFVVPTSRLVLVTRL